MAIEEVMLGLKKPCYACGKLVSLYRPAGAEDGAGRIFRKHRTGDVANEYCVGSHAQEEE